MTYTLHFEKIGLLLKTTAQNWYKRDPFRESAVIAYYAIFSLPGLLVVIFTFAGYFLDAEVLSGKLHGQIAQAMGKDTADQIQLIIVAEGVAFVPVLRRCFEQQTDFFKMELISH